MKEIRAVLKKTPVYPRYVRHRARRVTEGATRLNILKTFPAFEAHGWGLYPARAALTIQSINQVVPGLRKLASISNRHVNFENELTPTCATHVANSRLLSSLFKQYGSDKSSTHNYHEVYCQILKTPEAVEKIFEIGLGTNNIDVVSTMGPSGSPGASLRAFRDFCPNAQVYGADVDRRILFEDERIKTFFVDQTNCSSFDRIAGEIGAEFDLMIDDGLHAPNANIHSLNFFLPRLKVGGYAIIEDINPLTEDLWGIVTALLPANYCGAYLKTKAAHIYIVKRLDSGAIN